MDSFNILFTSVGRRVSLVRHVAQTLRELGVPGRIVTADLQTTAPAGFVGDIRELVPRVTDPGYIPRLLELCVRHDIKLLIPLIDTELQVLAEHREAFAAIGVTALISSPETVRLCNDKRLTAAFFERIGVGTPRLYEPEAVLADPQAVYPLLMKPADGSCSVGVTRIRNARELEFFRDYIDNPLLQEYVQGQEYTIDVLVDWAGRARAAVPRLRMETRGGEVSKGMTVKHPGLIAAALRIAEALPGAVGCITVQGFLTADGGLKFIEINPRFGGGFPLALGAGADFPKWLISWLLGREVSDDLQGWRDGTVMLRYDDAIFVTQDDIAH
ncbi:ATP-grasp domain-containing protein [Paenibacillus athensensis]|uniref:Transcriptional regulator n=1 Tax=Paenibacillus athensensis TaxID=1967502 RepID=A0A4Y8PY15_9BACL|nr:ATP-grasp domain-containing protein [Paenibacillus athensensis]MCD1258763.1 ATP-grasp domain-containing protein [Paenibacillus athensensis]